MRGDWTSVPFSLEIFNEILSHLSPLILALGTSALARALRGCLGSWVNPAHLVCLH